MTFLKKCDKIKAYYRERHRLCASIFPFPLWNLLCSICNLLSSLLFYINPEAPLSNWVTVLLFFIFCLLPAYSCLFVNMHEKALWNNQNLWHHLSKLSKTFFSAKKDLIFQEKSCKKESPKTLTFCPESSIMIKSADCILSSIANNTVVCNAAKSGCKAIGFARTVWTAALGGKATTGNALPVLQNCRFCNRA